MGDLEEFPGIMVEVEVFGLCVCLSVTESSATRPTVKINPH